jgi:hypothetical protein
MLSPVNHLTKLLGLSSFHYFNRIIVDCALSFFIVQTLLLSLKYLLKIKNIDKDVGKKGAFIHCGWECKLVKPLNNEQTLKQ